MENKEPVKKERPDAGALYAGFMERLWELLLLSILWIVCSLPVITAGAAATAAYYTAAKVIRYGADKVLSAFWSSFRRNLRQSIPLTLGVLPVLALLVFETMYLYSDPAVGLGMLYLMYLLIAVLLGTLSWLWPCLSRFDNGSLYFLRMAVIMAFRHLPSTIALLVLSALTLAGLWLMPWGILVFPGLYQWACVYLVEPVLHKYSPKPEDAPEEADKWYNNK